VTSGDRAFFAFVGLILVGLVIYYGPERVAPLASVGALLLALWLALRSQAGERPRLNVYSSRIIDAQMDWHEGAIGAVVEVKVINLSRAANAIADVELALVRGDVTWSAPAGDWVKLDETIVRLDMSDGVKWSIREAPARFPLTIPGLEAVRFLVFGVAPGVAPIGTYGLYSADEWRAFGEGRSEWSRFDLHSDALVVDVHGNDYHEPDPEQGEPSTWSDRILSPIVGGVGHVRGLARRIRRAAAAVRRIGR
jgi:hypothetical protein